MRLALQYFDARKEARIGDIHLLKKCEGYVELCAQLPWQIQPRIPFRCSKSENLVRKRAHVLCRRGRVGDRVGLGCCGLNGTGIAGVWFCRCLLDWG